MTRPPTAVDLNAVIIAATEDLAHAEAELRRIDRPDIGMWAEDVRQRVYRHLREVRDLYEWRLEQLEDIARGHTADAQIARRTREVAS